MIANLRILRKASGLSMKDFGALMGVSESTISLYETGKSEPGIEMMKKMADYFHVSIDTLVGRNSLEETKNQPLNDEELDDRVRGLIIRLNDRNTEKMIDYAELLLSSQEK